MLAVTLITFKSSKVLEVRVVFTAVQFAKENNELLGARELGNIYFPYFAHWCKDTIKHYKIPYM